MKITDPLIELLAIKLYEHAHPLGWFPRNPGCTVSWMKLPEEERERFRAMARGESEL